ncbi:MAG: hypothetical protein WAR59_14490 [Ignavibacteriaceae bacterium]
MRKIFLIVLGIVLLATIDFVLEYPKLGNFEIFFHKSFQTKYAYASLDFHNSLNDNDLVEILNLVLNKEDEYFLSMYFDNKAGHISKSINDYRISFKDGLKNSLLESWGRLNQTNVFYDELSDITDSIGIVINYKPAFVFGPVKKVDDNIYIGYDKWTAPMGSGGGVLQLNKNNGKWFVVKTISSWVS